MPFGLFFEIDAAAVKGDEVEEVDNEVQLDGGNDDAEGEHRDVDANSVTLASVFNNFILRR